MIGFATNPASRCRRRARSGRARLGQAPANDHVRVRRDAPTRGGAHATVRLAQSRSTPFRPYERLRPAWRCRGAPGEQVPRQCTPPGRTVPHRPPMSANRGTPCRGCDRGSPHSAEPAWRACFPWRSVNRFWRVVVRVVWPSSAGRWMSRRLAAPRSNERRRLAVGPVRTSAESVPRAAMRRALGHNIVHGGGRAIGPVAPLRRARKIVSAR